MNDIYLVNLLRGWSTICRESLSVFSLSTYLRASISRFFYTWISQFAWSDAPVSLIVVCVLHSTTDAGFACLHNLATHNHLVQDLVHLVKVEYQVELAHAPKVLVQHFDEQVDEFKHGELVVIRINADCEEETSVAPVDDFMVSVLQLAKVSCLVGEKGAMLLKRRKRRVLTYFKKACHFVISRNYDAM